MVVQNWYQQGIVLYFLRCMIMKKVTLNKVRCSTSSTIWLRKHETNKLKFLISSTIWSILLQSKPITILFGLLGGGTYVIIGYGFCLPTLAWRFLGFICSLRSRGDAWVFRVFGLCRGTGSVAVTLPPVLLLQWEIRITGFLGFWEDKITGGLRGT